MDFALKPQPLIAEVLPGFMMIGIIGVAYLANHPSQTVFLSQNESVAEVITAGFVGILVSWIVGTLFDTIRDLFEHLFDRWFPVNWEFLFRGPADEIQKLNETWLAYYFLSGNNVIALVLCGFCGAFIGAVHLNTPWLVLIFVAAGLFGWNSIFLRSEIRRIIGYQKGRFPHEGVYSRIKPAIPGFPRNPESDHGVGIFAIRDIPKGTLVFAPDDDRTAIVKREAVESLPEEFKRLYHDFCVLEGDLYTCPVNFNKLTVAWYANNSDEPNIAPDKSLHFRATRNIAAGEELTSRYKDYSENEEEPLSCDVK
jgi:hypothetical protein